MAKSKSRFLSFSFLSRSAAVLSLLSGGGYALYNSQINKANVAVETDVEEAAVDGEEVKTAHAGRLIPEFADRQIANEESAPIMNQFLAQADAAKKDVAPVGFSNLSSNNSPPGKSATPPSESTPPAINSFIPKSDAFPPKPKTSLSLTDIAKSAEESNSAPVASDSSFQPKSNPNFSPAPKSSESLSDAGEMPKKTADTQSDSKFNPAESPAKSSLTENAAARNGFTPPINPQPKPSPNLTPIPNTTVVEDRPARDPNQKSGFQPLPDLSKPATDGTAVKSAPSVIPKEVDPSANSQFSSAGSVATGVTPPTNNASISKSGLPQEVTPGGSANGNPNGIAPGPRTNTTLGNTINTNPSNGVPARSIGFNQSGTNLPNLPATNLSPGGFQTNSNANNQPTISGQARASLGTPNTNLAASTSNNLTVAAAPTPGNRELEGVQTPTLSMEKTAPREIQVGRPATFQLIVKNNGRVPAYGVTVVDEVPQGTQLKSAKPNPSVQEGNRLTWELGTLQPGDMAEISMELLPMQRGEIGSVARVAFQSQASVRTICTKPQLEIQHSAPAKALIGDDVVLKINVRNSGDGAATGVMIEEFIPENMIHADSNGRKLQYPVGTLAPGESRDISLRLKGQAPGLAKNVITTTGDGDLSAKDELNVEIVAPEIELSAEGPQLRFLERQATYDLQVANLGTASATNMQLVAKLPRGMQFVQTDKNGQYDPRSHAVYWSLLELPPGSKGDVKLTLLPIDVGSQKIEYQAQADLNINKVKEISVVVEQLSELSFDVADTADPIEVGSETVYEVRVVNQGTKPATNVQIQVKLPEAMQPASAEGPTQYQMTANSIDFMPIERLAPNGEARFRVQVKGQREGDHRIQVLLSCDDHREPVSKEESTKVYADR